MALPTTVLSGVGLKGHHPPVKSSGGAFYTVVRTDADELDVYKATDPTDSWSIQDSVDGPVHAATIIGYTLVQDGDVIHIVAWSQAVFEYYTFNMATDQWGEDELIENVTGNTPSYHMASIAVRSDGTIVVVYTGATDANMGDNKQRVDVNIGSSASPPVWSGPTALDAGGDTHSGGPNCILGTNDFVHCVFQHTTSTINDPPTSWVSSFGRSVDPADDSLSTAVQSTGDTGEALLGVPNLVTYDDAGTQKIAALGWKSFGADLQIITFDEDVNDELALDTVVSETMTITPGTANAHGVWTWAVIPGETTIHGLHNRASDKDLYYLEDAGSAGAGDPATEEIDVATVDFISATTYVRNGATVLAYLYDDADVQKYNEKELIAAGGTTATGAPSITAITSAGTTDLKKSATGAPSISNVTSAGTAEIEKTATGAPEITNITAAGVAEIVEGPTGSGAPDITNITATGTTALEKSATGAPSITAITAAGTGTVTVSVVITDVDGDETWNDGDTGLVITGTGFV